MSELMESDPTLVEAFLSALAKVPGAKTEAVAAEQLTQPYGRNDLVVHMTIAGKPLVLVIEVKNLAFPRDVREAVWQLRKYQPHQLTKSREHVVPFLIAETISPGAKETLRSEEVGYYDKGGSLYVPTPGAYILIDRPPPKKPRTVGSIFAGRKAQVLLTVFDHRNEWVTVKDIAKASDVSPATASQTLTEMERRDWMQSRGSGPTKARKLVDPSEMISAWAQYRSAVKPPRPRRYYVSGTSEDVMQSLAGACDATGAKYAITGEAAAQRYAPYLSNISQVVCRMLAGTEASKALSAIEARPVTEGWNLAVHESKTTADFSHARKVDMVWLASPLEVYLDLQGAAGRAKEMAEHLRRGQLAS
jgi:hypothetical protein